MFSIIQDLKDLHTVVPVQTQDLRYVALFSKMSVNFPCVGQNVGEISLKSHPFRGNLQQKNDVGVEENSKYLPKVNEFPKRSSRDQKLKKVSKIAKTN